jgi:hypothetical protein
MAFRREGACLTVDIEGLEVPIFGRGSLVVTDLEGLCLRTRESGTSITLAIQGQPLIDEQVGCAVDPCWVKGRGNPVTAYGIHALAL